MLSIIVAYNKKGVIGKDGQVPWRIPQDLKRFKDVTMGHPIIMGRKTHESIGRLLPGRTNIIITRNKEYIPLDTHEPVYVVHSLSAALEIAFKEDSEAFVIGGEEIYRMALPFADKIYATFLPFNEEDGDAVFPNINTEEWNTNLWVLDGRSISLMEDEHCEWYIRTRRKKK